MKKELKPEVKEGQKLSYEELERTATQLSQQAQQLYEQLQKANLQNMFVRLQFLFEVVKQPDVFRGDFYQSCVDEIEQLMNLKAEIPAEGEAPVEDDDDKHEATDTHID